ncbi:hypothetical protein F5I97DRAFT_1926109 [Phlebopus sp. FC_14]|nr:hypothetical protein F5I97DRAFT_1926109 [Phlebopus sp. FC_14]
MARPRSESPPASLLSSAPSSPNLRNRNPFAETVATSPTSVTMSDASVGLNDTPQTAFRSHPAGFTGSRKSTIRSDPALVTCFDPADRRLYDLWAPKY